MAVVIEIAVIGVLAMFFAMRLAGRLAPRPMAMALEQFFLTNPIRMRFFGPRQALALLGDAGGKRILEIGTGVGVILEALFHRVGPDGLVAGLDIQPQAISYTASRLKDAGAEHADVRLGSAVALPWSNQTFDRVLMVSMLGELPDTQRVQALREMARVLRSDGQGILTEFWPDPHYIGEARLKRYCLDAGLEVVATYHAPLLYSLRVLPQHPVGNVI
ncbi:MAG: class I SAM-dependent methyltransferase [Sulfobacillus sp.]